MAGKKVYIAEFDANADPYLRKLKGIETKTATMSQKVEGSIGKINASYLKMAAGIAAVGTVTNFIAESIKAYGEEEKAIKRLDTSLGRANRTLTQYAATLQKITTYADDQILDAMALISNYVKEEAMVKKLTKATLDFATAKGIDLSSAAEIVAKTVGSSTNALRRQGIEFDNNLKGVDRLNAVLEQLSRFQGQAEGQAETYTGKLEQLNNQLGDLQEQIGAGVLPTLNEFSTALTDIASKLGSSGISELLDKYLKLLFIVPRTGLAGINAIGDFLGIGGGSDLNPADFITNTYSQGITSGNNNAGGKKPGNRRITGGNTTRDSRGSQIGASGILNNTAALGIDRLSREMTEVVIPELDMAFADIGMSFVDKFSETQNIASNIGRIFNVSADSFVGKLMQAFDVGSSILSIIGSITSLVSGGPAGMAGGLLGLAEGGTVINKNGKLSYSAIPKFARGGSYMVPPGYSNDSGLIRVQSGERVDVTPSSQVPMVAKAFQELKSVMMAGNMNSARKSKQPIVVYNVMDGQVVSKNVIKNQNRMAKAGKDFGDFD